MRVMTSSCSRPARLSGARCRRFLVVRAILIRRRTTDSTSRSAASSTTSVFSTGSAARRALEAAGAELRTDARVADVDEIEADAIVLAVPPEEGSRLLEEHWAFEPSPIVSVHLLVDRRLFDRHAALLSSPVHWIFDR